MGTSLLLRIRQMQRSSYALSTQIHLPTFNPGLPRFLDLWTNVAHVRTHRNVLSPPAQTIALILADSLDMELSWSYNIKVTLTCNDIVIVILSPVTTILKHTTTLMTYGYPLSFA